ncbi:hypothetical protein [Luedemannella flava]|uniref:hypothetical protein n=1 Tax=Luedemannella flava TaxID=349316 RepID=UPI0031DFF6DF
MGSVALAVTLAATLAPVPDPDPAPSAPPRVAPRDQHLLANGPQYVYDRAYARAGTAIVAFRGPTGRATVVFVVQGMPHSAWGRTFGVHVHRDRCGRTAASAGPHFSNPRAPRGARISEREIWLDVRVLPGGWGMSRTTTTYAMPDGANAHSVVLHARPTNRSTGDAGARLFCTNVDMSDLPSVG